MSDLEVELKLNIPYRHVYDAILQDPSLFHQSIAREYETTYYDTADGRLRTNGLAYRIRRTGDEFTATVKDGGRHEGGLHIRHEWNRPLPQNEPDITAFDDLPVGKTLRAAIGPDSLEPLFTTSFIRHGGHYTSADGSVIEVAADLGTILCGSSRESISELELELKSGQITSVLRLGAHLAEGYGLTAHSRSKFARGLSLAGLAPDMPQAPRPEPHKHSPLPRALTQLLIGSTQEILSAYEEYIAAPTDKESVHELRVKIRRLRSLLAFFRPLVDPEQYETAQTMLKTLAGDFACLRELDVLHEEWGKLAPTLSSTLAGRMALDKCLQTARHREHTRLAEQHDRGLSTAALLTLWADLTDLSHDKFPHEQLTLGEYAERQFEDWLNRLARDHHQLDSADYTAIHNLRLSVKKSRYVLSCLEPVLTKRHHKMLPRLKNLQDCLGAICDGYRHTAVLTHLTERSRSPLLQYERGLMTGWQLAGRQRLLAKLAKLEL